MPESQPIEHVPENWLAKALSLPQKKLRARRTPGVLDLKADGIVWPVADAIALATELGLTLPLPQKNPAPAAEDGELLTVASVSRGPDGRHFPNPHVIQASRRNGELVTVRVVHSGKYRPTLRLDGKPMTFRARKAAGNWWVLLGREPRFPGQW